MRNDTNLTELHLAELWNGVLEATLEGSDENVTRLDWLESLLTEVSGQWPKTTEDPEAAETAIAESKEMVRQLRNLFSHAADYDEERGEGK